MYELQTRHGHHHKDNVKYGYLIFCISVVYALVFALANYVFLRKWNVSGVAPVNSVWGRLRSYDRWWIHIILWVLLLVTLTFFHVSEPIKNFLSVAKRLGRLAYCVLPLDVSLMFKPSLLANSYLELVTLHKWFLRLIIAASFAHGLGFILKWLIEGSLGSKLSLIPNLLGLVILVPASGLMVISLRPVRERVYRYFYLWHNVVVILLLIPTFWHARPGVADFILLLVAMLAFQLYHRLSEVYAVGNINIVDHSMSSLQVLKIQKPLNYPALWEAGSHIRLSYKISDIRYWIFPSHPYTVITLPDDGTIDLIVRKGLQFQVFSSLNYTLSSPRSSLSRLFLETAELVVILCGGSGISLAVPIYRKLLSRSLTSAKIVWCIANTKDSFVLKDYVIADSVDIYCTRELLRVGASEGLSDEQASSLLSNNEETLEMHSLDIELLGKLKEDQQHSPGELKSFKSGRPNLDEIFSELVVPGGNNNHWIVVCGPAAMIKEAKKWGSKNKVQVFSEHYGY